MSKVSEKYSVLTVAGTERARQALTGNILILAFVLLLGGYFLASYLRYEAPVQFQERQFTAHDDLLAVDGRQRSGATAVGKFGAIFYTADGGKIWQRRPSGTANTLTAVSFSDAAHGYIVGAGGVVLATADSGASWQAQQSGSKDQLLGVYALSANEAVGVGAFGTLIMTGDGGRTWSKQELKWDVLIERIVKDGGYLEPNLNAAFFSSRDNGWIVGEFGLVLHTGDGGKTWSSQRYGSDLPQLYAVKFLDDRRGTAIGQAGSVIHTDDGGQHWTAVDVSTGRDLHDLSLDGERGVIIGEGVVLGSGDGGLSWAQLNSGSDGQSFNSVALRGGAAIVVGRAGAIRVFDLDTAKEKQTR
jgi:photosystem II stability/assembly factor-like uncharacterized protein